MGRAADGVEELQDLRFAEIEERLDLIEERVRMITGNECLDSETETCTLEEAVRFLTSCKYRYRKAGGGVTRARFQKVINLLKGLASGESR